MRPRSEVRMALGMAFERQAPCGWRDVLPAAAVNVRSPSEVRLVRRTVENMVRSGELAPVGLQKAAGSRVWVQMYEPVLPDEGRVPAGSSESEREQMREDALRAIGVITGGWRPDGMR